MIVLEQLLKLGLNQAQDGGADYAEIMAMERKEKKLCFENGEVACNQCSDTAGLTVRVLVAGRWGFASAPMGGKATVRKLVAGAIAGASFAPEPWRPVRLSACFPTQGEWASPCQIDPFALPGAKLLEMLRAADDAMNIEGIQRRVAGLTFRRDTQLYLNSEGTRTSQVFTQSGGGISAWALGPGESQQRSWPCPGGSFAGQGYEYILELDLPGNGGRIAREAVALTKATPCPDAITDLILSGSQLAVQIHHTCGARAQLGATGSFALEGLGEIRFGSPLLTIYADATAPGLAGSFAYDQEGTKAQAFALVREGKVVNFLSGREHAAAIGRFSSGAMRSVSWSRPPSPQMTNLILQPGRGSLDDLIASTDRGILLDSARSFCIGPNRQGFVAQAELGWLIEGGKIKELVKNPIYIGYPTAFWSGCDAIAGPDQGQMFGLADAGLAVGHKVVPLRIRGVKVGTWR